MNIAAEMLRLRLRGMDITVEQGTIRLQGPATPSDINFVRTHKQETLCYLNAPTTEVYDSMRRLAPALGTDVVVDGRTVVLWGLTPRGPIVDTGPFLITVDFEAVSLPPDS